MAPLTPARSAPPSLPRRDYDDAADYWRVRDFLRAVYLLNGRRERAWSLLRWDYWRWHVHANIFNFPLDRAVCLWEHDGRLAAVLNPDGPGEAFLQIHPGCQCIPLVAEMVSTAEARLVQFGPDGRRGLRIWLPSDAAEEQAFLLSRGYQQAAGPEYQRRRPMCEPVPSVPVPAGYIIRALGDDSELPARSWASWKAFHPDEPDNHYQGWEWYRNVQRVPLYRRDLDIVAVTPEGAIAAFCTAWFDDVTRTVVFEPVGTQPAHQRRGLGKAVMAEGLRRAQRLGAVLATVGSYSSAAHALYASMGFVDYDLSEPWDKSW
jgi:GNAT superfamily N-acetyltransferase